MAMTRMEALEAGFILNLRKEPIVVDVTSKLYKAIEVNAANELMPLILGGMEDTVKAKATEMKLSVEQLPMRFEDLFAQWRNWPNVKSGPICGYVDYAAIFSMDNTTPSMLMTLKDEGK